MAHRVTFDGVTVFDAEYAQEGAWNGWAAVGFTREQADAVAAYCNQLATEYPDTERLVWDDERQAYRIEDSSAFPLDPPEYIEADARGLYPIGSYAWTWTVVDDDEDDIERLQVLGLRP